MNKATRWLDGILQLLALCALAACGGGGGGGGGSNSVPGGGSTGSALPQITASVLTFQVENIPSYVSAKGGNSLVVVSVTDSQTGAAMTNATVSANGSSLSYVSAQKVYQGWLIASTGDTVSLSVATDTATYQAVGNVPPTYPQIQSPRTSTISASLEDLDVKKNAFVSWNGDLPDASFNFAVALLDETGNLVWPTHANAQTIGHGSQNSTTIPGANLPSNFPYIATGLTQAIVISGAAAGSTLTMGAYSGSMVYAPTALPSLTLTSLAISPAPVSLVISKHLQLAATGAFADRNGQPNASTQDLTGQVTWTSDAPGVVSVGATGLLTAVSNGVATITSQLNGVSASQQVTVFEPGATPIVGDAYAYQMNASHTGNIAWGGQLVFPTSATWTVSFPQPVSYPIITDTSVFVLATEGQSATDSGTSMYAFDLTTGSPRWGPVAVTAVPGANFTYDHGVLVTIVRGCTMRGYDAATGTVIWSVSLAGENVWSCGSVPTAYRGIVYAVGSGVESTVFAVDVSSGKILWASAIIGEGTAPSVTDDGVYVAGYLQAYKLDPYSGVMKWHYVGPGFGGGQLAAPVFGNALYMRGPNGSPNLIFDARSGVSTGTFQSYLIPAFGNGSAFMLGQDGTLTATSLDAAKAFWTTTDTGILKSAPIVVNNAVITSTASGWVKAYDVSTGSELWSAAAGAGQTSADESNLMFAVSGLSAGHGFLAVAASNVLSIYRLTGP